MPETVQPPVTWAQRNNLVYLNVVVQEIQDPVIKVDKDKLYFKGKSGADQKVYEMTLDLFGTILPDESKYSVKGRNIEFVLIKEDQEASYWTRLLKENKKNHWLKVDFSKWKDEDESDDEAGPAGGGGGPPGMGGMGGGADFEEMMRSMGGMGGLGGMPGMGGMPDDFGDLGGEEGDSDDEDLPDLEAVPDKEQAKA
ncbi:Protein wos2 [Halotydeus destructor]|nr:Protein wos2 [Halotydeus destructor]